ncbi:hypothetical protein Tco_0026420 [Tanacetum coccineum]
MSRNSLDTLLSQCIYVVGMHLFTIMFRFQHPSRERRDGDVGYGYGLDYTSREPVTEYRVLSPMISGFSWLKLCPLTNHKHQIHLEFREEMLMLQEQMGVSSNYGVNCEDKAKRRNSGAKMKTFEENCYLLPYAISRKEDMAY